ncbi:Zinc finger CCHC-type and RNA-binding motif-containing protein 1 [Heterocephalus glaber]|uniref:Zinc finger CCHC-type and RNA-binding motif-containing protein 1 n=1 Tax=Heterocephalus glaber TaxID=10181 RepID=G5BV07_HETGA|nr:Zinc finger CCHC-type and RNA-binding motif-containing protein 1 [Heterocephalus glaber]
MLGEREPPKKKEKKKKKKIAKPEKIEDIAESEDEGEDPALDSLSQAIAPSKPRLKNRTSPQCRGPLNREDPRSRRMKKSTYFSDEEEFSD